MFALVMNDQQQNRIFTDRQKTDILAVIALLSVLTPVLIMIFTQK